MQRECIGVGDALPASMVNSARQPKRRCRFQHQSRSYFATLGAKRPLETGDSDGDCDESDYHDSVHDSDPHDSDYRDSDYNGSDPKGKRLRNHKR